MHFFCLISKIYEITLMSCVLHIFGRQIYFLCCTFSRSIQFLNRQKVYSDFTSITRSTTTILLGDHFYFFQHIIRNRLLNFISFVINIFFVSLFDGKKTLICLILVLGLYIIANYFCLFSSSFYLLIVITL